MRICCFIRDFVARVDKNNGCAN